MKSATGVVRRVDDLGRVVIPKEIRRTLSITEDDAVEIFVDSEGEIILRKYQPGCLFCGGMEHLRKHANGKAVCLNCINSLIEVSPC